jgi:hypothetical protein
MMRGPDSVEWQVRVLRVRFPEGHQSAYDPAVDGDASAGSLASRSASLDAVEYLLIEATLVHATCPPAIPAAPRVLGARR